MGEGSDRLGDPPPFVGVPSFGFGDHLAVLANEQQGRGFLDAEAGRNPAVRIREGEEFVGVGTEVGPSVLDRASDDPAGPASGTLEVIEDPPGGVEDPGTLVRVWIEYDRNQREGRHEPAEGSGLTIQRSQFEFEISCHGGQS